jgi:hypothetical protein
MEDILDAFRRAGGELAQTPQEIGQLAQDILGCWIILVVIF